MNRKMQTTAHILMVRPSNFSFNTETAVNNAFQTNDTSLTPSEIQARALVEFDAFVAKLRSRAVQVMVAQDSVLPVKPDAVFPNNWVSMHADGTVLFYPMNAVVRRLERADNIVELIESQYIVQKKIHLEHYEAVGKFLEGTGSMIFDRTHEIVYACLSPRTDLGLLDEFSELMGFKRVAFRAVDGEGQEIYHTNVMMAVGETFVVICLETVPEQAERLNLIRHFDQTGKEIIEISLKQMMQFAGNMLQVRNEHGETFLIMSEQAHKSLDAQQIAHIERHTEILSVDIKTIETYGGGSARCMMAEIFLEKK
jgi:hypothetical protein